MEANDTVAAFFCVDDPELGPAVDRAVRAEGKTLAHVLGIKATKDDKVKAAQAKNDPADEHSVKGDPQAEANARQAHAEQANPGGKSKTPPSKGVSATSTKGSTAKGDNR